MMTELGDDSPLEKERPDLLATLNGLLLLIVSRGRCMQLVPYVG